VVFNLLSNVILRVLQSMVKYLICDPQLVSERGQRQWRGEIHADLKKVVCEQNGCVLSIVLSSFLYVIFPAFS